IAIRGDYKRKTSCLSSSVLGANGAIDYYNTEGTLDQVQFLKCLSKPFLPKKRYYPGPNNAWILEGAAIPMDLEIVYFLRSGVAPTFLPAYSSFFNPIECEFFF
ncbi:hypothetical protein L917_11957, partial [Phytophthora nicotianae]